MTAVLTKPRTQQVKKSNGAWYPPPQGQWTYEDYLHLPDNGMTYEVIKGSLYMAPAPRPKHQKLSMRLSYALHHFVEQHQLGEIYPAPIDLMFLDLATPVQPDILFVPADRLDMIQETIIEGVPPLLIEILSPSTAGHDRHRKFKLYAEAEVAEYWIVDPATCTFEIFVLRGNAYAPLGKFGKGDVLRSEVLAGFTVNVDEIC